MFVESMCVEMYPNKNTEQAFEYFDYLANLTSDWAYTGTQNNVTKLSTSIFTEHIDTKYQLVTEDNIDAKHTALTKQVEALAFAKATTSVPKKTSIICARCDTINHSTNVCPIVDGVKEACG